MRKLYTSFNTLDILKDNEKSDILFEILEQISLVGEEELDTIGCYVIDVLTKHGLVINEQIMKILKNQKLLQSK